MSLDVCESMQEYYGSSQLQTVDWKVAARTSLQLQRPFKRLLDHLSSQNPPQEIEVFTLNARIDLHNFYVNHIGTYARSKSTYTWVPSPTVRSPDFNDVTQFTATTLRYKLCHVLPNDQYKLYVKGDKRIYKVYSRANGHMHD